MSDRVMEADDQVSILSTESRYPNPETVNKIIRRLRALTLILLPLQASPDQISDPTSRIITPKVVAAYSKAAGDYAECLPYCLLRARQTFMHDASMNPADYDENIGRAIACEVLARRIMHKVPPERLNDIMSTRMRYKEWDGDDSALTSALETAIDQHCTIFLSSSEAQNVVNALWRGDWVQQTKEGNDIDYVPYKPYRDGSFLDHLDPARLAVPRYLNWFRIIIWFLFLFVYSQAVQEPLEMTLDPHHPFDAWEFILYGMALAFTVEETYKIFKTLRFFTYKALTFWNTISVLTNALFITAFTLRAIGLNTPDEEKAAGYKLRSFQTLSVIAPLLWMRLITVVDGYKYIGTMQICISRMIEESGIFFVLLALIGIGFAQSMYALDYSDGHTEHGALVINSLIQGLLGSPDFEASSENPINLIVFYLWNIFTTIILLNILISLFSSAYDDITTDAEAHFLAFFAGKTVAMIRAPDSFVYPAPFNLIEIAFIAPLEPFLSRKTYAKYNRIVMIILFFIPLTMIALFEAHLDVNTNKYMRNMFSAVEEGEENDPHIQNPSMEGEPDGLQISRVAFDDLTKAFPDSFQSAEASIISQIQALSAKLDKLQRHIDGTAEKGRGSSEETQI